MSFDKEHQEYYSFSELKTYRDCGRKHDLIYNQNKINDAVVSFLVFGEAIHYCLENTIQDESLDALEFYDSFDSVFEEQTDEYRESKKMPALSKNEKSIRREQVKEILKSHRSNAEMMLSKIHDSMWSFFPEGWSVAHTEIKVYDKLDAFDYKFKGFIDLVIKKKDGTYAIIDWKTCNKTWNKWKRSDESVYNQLLLYKKALSEKENIPLEEIETYFVLLKKDDPENIELLKIKSDKILVDNALSWMDNIVKLSRKKIKLLSKWKNSKNGCMFCPFNNTKDCK